MSRICHSQSGLEKDGPNQVGPQQDGLIPETYLSPGWNPASVPEISFFVECVNEECNLRELVAGITRKIPQAIEFELILIDNSSSDASWEIIQALADIYPNQVVGIRLQSRRSQKAAIEAGRSVARGNSIIDLDSPFAKAESTITHNLLASEQETTSVSPLAIGRRSPIVLRRSAQEAWLWFRRFPSRYANDCSIAYATLGATLLATSLILGPSSAVGIFCVLAGLGIAGFSAACFLAGFLGEITLEKHELARIPVSSVPANRNNVFKPEK